MLGGEPETGEVEAGEVEAEWRAPRGGGMGRGFSRCCFWMAWLMLAIFCLRFCSRCCASSCEMLFLTSFFPLPSVPALFMNTPWFGATAAAYPAAGLEEEEAEGGGMKMLVGEEERAAMEEEGVGASVCRA